MHPEQFVSCGGGGGIIAASWSLVGFISLDIDIRC